MTCARQTKAHWHRRHGEVCLPFLTFAIHISIALHPGSQPCPSFLRLIINDLGQDLYVLDDCTRSHLISSTLDSSIHDPYACMSFSTSEPQEFQVCARGSQISTRQPRSLTISSSRLTECTSNNQAGLSPIAGQSPYPRPTRWTVASIHRSVSSRTTAYPPWCFCTSTFHVHFKFRLTDRRPLRNY